MSLTLCCTPGVPKVKVCLCKKQIRGKDKRKDLHLHQHVLKDLQRSRGKTVEHTGEFTEYRGLPRA